MEQNNKGKKKYKMFNKYDVVYADFGSNPNGVEGGLRPGVVVSCNASNHKHAPQLCIVPLSSKLKDIPVHVPINPSDVRGYNLRYVSDFMPEDVQTIAKKFVGEKNGYIPRDSIVREMIDTALIMQFDLLPVARKIVMEEMGVAQNG